MESCEWAGWAARQLPGGGGSQLCDMHTELDACPKAEFLQVKAQIPAEHLGRTTNATMPLAFRKTLQEGGFHYKCSSPTA